MNAEQITKFKIEWTSQLAAILGGVRRAWLLQTTEAAYAPFIEEYADTAEFRQELENAGSFLADQSTAIAVRKVFGDNRMEVFITSADNSLDEFSDEQLLNDDSLRKELLDYEGNDAAVQQASTRLTYIIEAVKDDISVPLFAYVCTPQEEGICGRHAMDIAYRMRRVLPIGYDFSYDRRIDVGKDQVFQGLWTGQQLNPGENNKLSEIIENAGFITEGEEIPLELNCFQRGMLYALALVADNEATKQSNILFDDPNLEPGMELRQKLDQAQLRVGELFFEALRNASTPSQETYDTYDPNE